MAALEGLHVYRGGIEAQGGSTLHFRSQREDPGYRARGPESAVTRFPACSAAPRRFSRLKRKTVVAAHRNVLFTYSPGGAFPV